MIIYQHGNMIATGRLAKDAEFRVAGARQSHFTNLSIPAAEKDGETIWVNVTCAFEVADAARTLKKGDRVLVAGVMKTRTYTNREGEERQVSELNADVVFPMAAPLDVGELASKYPSVVKDSNQFADLDDEDDGELPF